MTPEKIQKMAEGFPPSSIGKNHEEVVAWLAKNHVALQEQGQKLAAENSALIELYRQTVKELDDTCFEIGMMRGEKSMEYPAPETPATDAVIREIGAKAVEEYSKTVGAEKNGAIYAAKLRAGEVS